MLMRLFTKVVKHLIENPKAFDIELGEINALSLLRVKLIDTKHLKNVA